MDVDPDATTPGKLRSRVLVSSKTVRFKRNPNGGDGLGNFISVKLDQYFISGVDGDGNIFDDVAYFGVEVGNQPEEADPEVKVEPTQRIMEHVALVDFQGQTYVVLTHKKIK